MLKGTCHCGEASWTFEGDPGTITVCNCTLCRRYAALWAYDFENERIRIAGPTKAYTRAGKPNPPLEMLFCPSCACILCWRGLLVEPDRRRRMAVNIRLAPPDEVASLAIERFDGLHSFQDLPIDGRCVRDFWF